MGYNVTPQGATINGDSILFPKNTGETDIEYTVTYTDEQCTASTQYKVLVKAGESCQDKPEPPAKKDKILNILNSNLENIWSSSNEVNKNILANAGMALSDGYELYYRSVTGVMDILNWGQYTLLVSEGEYYKPEDAEEQETQLGDDAIACEIVYDNKQAYNVADELKSDFKYSFSDYNAGGVWHFHESHLRIPLNHNWFYKCYIEEYSLEPDNSFEEAITNYYYSPNKHGFWYTKDSEQINHRHATIKIYLKDEPNVKIEFPLFVDPTPIKHVIKFNNPHMVTISTYKGTTNCVSQDITYTGNEKPAELVGYMLSFKNLLNYKGPDNYQNATCVKNYLGISYVFSGDKQYTDNIEFVNTSENKITIYTYRDYIPSAKSHVIIKDENSDGFIWKYETGVNNTFIINKLTYNNEYYKSITYDKLTDFYNIEGFNNTKTMGVMRYDGFGGYYRGSGNMFLNNRLLKDIHTMHYDIDPGGIPYGDLVLIPVFSCELDGFRNIFAVSYDKAIILPDNINGAGYDIVDGEITYVTKELNNYELTILDANIGSCGDGSEFFTRY